MHILGLSCVEPMLIDLQEATEKASLLVGTWPNAYTGDKFLKMRSNTKLEFTDSIAPVSRC